MKLKLDINSRLLLNNEQEIPLLGMGVWQIQYGKQTEQAVAYALEAGYRHFDTARIYLNEASVGKAIRESSVRREDVWVTTKLWPADFVKPTRAFEDSLKKLDLEYIDLYLMHWPVYGLEKHIWKAMESIYESGLCRAIGVSNFGIRELEKVLSIAKYPPTVNQIKLSPFNFDQSFCEYNQKQGISVEAYSPLTRGKMLNSHSLSDIAKKYKKTSAQILIRWALQKRIIVIPKAQNPEHIIENADVFDFEIAKSDMLDLDSLSNADY